MKSEKGQSLVEFALILPILIMILFGIVDFGRAFHAYLTIDHAGREAARAASIGKDEATVKSVAANQGSSIGLTASMVSVSATSTEATIKITYPFDFITPILGPIVNINLTDTTVMRIE